MSQAKWNDIERIFNNAADRPADAREDFLRSACGTDHHVYREVKKLLDSLEEADDFIESPVWHDTDLVDSTFRGAISDSLENGESPDPDDRSIGKRVGAFRLVSEIGRGGMGSVYLAERADGEFDQKVAVKIIKRGMDSDFIIRRFRHERQILASFEHPHIARLLDGGTTDDGVPYFVMEYIDGETLYKYCDANQFTTTARLDLFQKICSALEYAHERQIVHRDIKPGNILIDRHGTPKLLDFGIAKILDPELIHESVNPTASMLRLLTPDYASPEQLQSGEITPASDIYSLGVLLYELLSGHRPFQLKKKTLAEVTKTVCEEIPVPPSKAAANAEGMLSIYEGDLNRLAAVRDAELDQLKQQIQGPLDNIVMKCLAKDPSDRYTSVKALIEDIRRFLAGRAVQAPSFSVWLNSNTDLLQRISEKSTRLAVLPLSLINLGPVPGAEDKYLGVGLADALITRLSRIRRFVVRPTSSVLRFDHGSADPVSAGTELNVQYILDGNIKRAGDQVRVTIQLLDVAENAAIWAASIDERLTDILALEDTVANRVMEALLPQLDSSDIEQFGKRGTYVPAAFDHYLKGRYNFNKFTEEGFATAFINFHHAIAADPNYALAYTGIADYYNWLGIIGVLPPQECFDPAIEAARKAIELDPDLSNAHSSLGFSIHAGHYDQPQAENHLRRALELDPANANAYVWLGIVLFTQGRFDEGFRFARQATEFDPLSPFAHHNIGWALYYARRYEEAAAQYRKVVSTFPEYGLGHYGLAKVLRSLGKTEEALAVSQKASEMMGGGIFSSLGEAESHAAAGNTDLARKMVAEIEELSQKRYVSPYMKALAYGYLGETNRVLDLLEESLALKDAWLNWASSEPVLDLVKDQPRFIKIIEAVGDPNALPATEETGAVFAKESEPDLHDRTTLIVDGSPTAETLRMPTRFTLARSGTYVAIALLLVAAIFGGVHFILRPLYAEAPTVSRSPSNPNPTVVVLPFRSGDGSNFNLGTGLADALTNRLGNIKALRVLSSSTARRAAVFEMDALRNDLKADFVIRGELLTRNGATSIKAELAETGSGRIISSDTFTSEDGDLFGLQSRIAEMIWTGLNIEPLPLEKEQVQKSYTRNAEAYELYLIGKYQLSRRSPADLRQAISTFGTALKHDAEFAQAYVGLAEAYALIQLYDTDPPPEAYESARGYALKALGFDDNLAEAHAIFAYISFYSDRDRKEAELDFRRAIQINPSLAQAHHWFALFLAATGKATEALQEIETARQLDPASLSVNSAAGMVRFFTGDLDGAINESERALEIDPSFVPALKVKRWAEAAKGDIEAAGSTYLKEIAYSGGNETHPGWKIIAAQAGRLGTSRDEALKLLDQAAATETLRGNPYAYAFEIALAYNALGESERTLDFLELAERAGSHGINYLKADPRLAALHRDPRFIRIAEALEEIR